MEQTEFDILEYLASQRGKSAATLYAESGGKAFTEISNELTDGKGFNIIHDVNGHAIGAINNSTGEILGNLSSGTTYGTAAETTASGYNIVTTATTTADEAAGTIKTELASGTNEAATSAAGKAGATLSGVTMQTAIFSGVAALGGVAKGVKWYRDNPDFWESLSHKLLPFAYGDKYGDGSSDSWGDIFEKAIIPTAVGADGKTYLQEDFLNTLAQGLIAGGFYTTGGYIPAERPTEISGNVTLDPPTLNQWAGFGGMYSALVTEIKKNEDFLNPDYNTPCILEVFSVDNNKLKVCPWALTKQEIAYKNLENNGSYNTDETIYFGKRILTRGFVSYNVLTGQTNIGGGGGQGHQKVGAFTDLDIAGVMAITNNWFICPSGFIQRTPIDGTFPESGATYPQKDSPISETYPDWLSRALQTLDPESTPDNPTYKYWYPVSIQNQKDTDGKTEGANTTDTQTDAQTGNNPDSKTAPDAMTVAQEKIAEALKELTKIFTKQKIDIPTDTDTPTDTGETPPSIPPIISGSSNGLWAIYNPSQSELQSFGAWLWSSDIIDQIVKMISNPMDAIIGLHTIYVTPPTSGAATIKAGYLDSGVSAAKVSNQYTSIDCGTVTIPEKYQNALDYDYTRVSIYLPFIGIIPLNTRDVMGASLHLTYRVDVLTGTCLAQIRVTKQNSNAVLYTYSGNCAVQIPLTSGNYGTLLTGLLSAVGGVVASVASGGAALPAVAGIGSAALNSHTNVSQSGNLGSNAGALGIRKPYVIITRPTPYNAENYPSFYGIPAQKYVMLGNVSGFTKVRKIHVEGLPATEEEKTMIESILQEGVII